jgi:hypothetical protein
MNSDGEMETEDWCWRWSRFDHYSDLVPEIE